MSRTHCPSPRMLWNMKPLQRKPCWESNWRDSSCNHLLRHTCQVQIAAPVEHNTGTTVCLAPSTTFSLRQLRGPQIQLIQLWKDFSESIQGPQPHVEGKGRAGCCKLRPVKALIPNRRWVHRLHLASSEPLLSDSIMFFQSDSLYATLTASL